MTASIQIPLEIHADQIEVLRSIHKFKEHVTALRASIPVTMIQSIDLVLNSISDRCEELETEWKKWVMNCISDKLNDPDLFKLSGINRLKPWRVYVQDDF
jgi:hypothetical protein